MARKVTITLTVERGFYGDYRDLNFILWNVLDKLKAAKLHIGTLHSAPLYDLCGHQLGTIKARDAK